MSKESKCRQCGSTTRFITNPSEGLCGYCVTDTPSADREMMSPNTIDLMADKLDALVTLVRRAQIDGNALMLGSALQQLERVAETAASTTRTVVELQRQAGASWADIGRLLDMTRQAAQQRFSG